MDFPINPMEQILIHMRNELEELRKDERSPDKLEHLKQIEQDIRLIEAIASRSADTMTFH